MTYATLDDLIKRAGETEIRQIADRDNDGTPDADVVEAALRDADEMIDGYVATKYPLPFETVPRLLRTWATSIARKLLHRNGAPEHVEDDHKDALAALRHVADGRITLPAAGDEASEPSTGGHQSHAPPEVFTAEKLRGW